MSESSTLFGELDVFKYDIDIAVADAPRDGDVRQMGSVRGNPASPDKALCRLVSWRQPLKIVFETGLCGVVVWRRPTGQRLQCEAVAL